MTNSTIKKLMNEMDRFTLHDLFLELEAKGFVTKEWKEESIKSEKFEQKKNYIKFTK